MTAPNAETCPDLGPALVGALAVRALREEAGLAPKPGLVDPGHRGAHDDMDYGLLLASAEALGEAFEACAEAGAGFPAEGDPRELLAAIRPIGIAGERAMMEATGGVNAHRGALFCLGLLAASVSRNAASRSSWPRGGVAGPATPPSLAACLYAGAMCDGMVGQELAGEGATGGRGRRLYREFGARGARGEAEAGFPTLRRRVLPKLREAREAAPAAERAARLDALLGAMRELEDGCVLYRGGPRGLGIVKAGAAQVLEAGGAGTGRGLASLLALDSLLCSLRLSPGGSADMLAAGLFLDYCERAWSGEDLTSRESTGPERR